MILKEIVKQKRIEVKRDKEVESIQSLKEKIEKLEGTRDFKGALAKEGISLIAELKKGSPSKGIIREDFDPVSIAMEYQSAGASALSVLTDRTFFWGDLGYLNLVKDKVGLPLLRKDFIIDPCQIYRARAYGADAILLIVAILTPKELGQYLSLAQELDLDVLVEVHNRQELQIALDVDAQIIGINNRDLKVFQVDLATTIDLQKLVPKGKLIVSESGIRDRKDIDRLSKNHIDGVLIGESLMRSDNIGAKVRELIG